MKSGESGIHRHDISDELWGKIEVLLPGRAGAWGRAAADNRRFINAVGWIVRTGAPWRDLPPEYGGWKNMHRRFCRWRDKGVWEKLAREVMGELDTDWLMIDSSCIKVHADGCGARGGAHKRGLNTKLHLAIDKTGKPVRMILSAGQAADCSFAMDLAAGLPIRVLFADKGYDVNCLVDAALAGDTQVVIPPKKNRKVQRAYGKELYKERHLIENVFRRLKQWRGIASRFAKRADSFLAACYLRCIFLFS